MHHSHVPEVPSRTLCLFFLSEATEQGYFQGTERQTLLPWMLRQALWIRRNYVDLEEGDEEKMATRFYYCYQPLEKGSLWIKENRCNGVKKRQGHYSKANLLDRVRRRAKGKQRRLYIYSQKRKQISPKTLMIPLFEVNRDSRVGDVFRGVLVIGKGKDFYPSFIQFVRYPAHRRYTLGIQIYCQEKSYCSYQYQKLITCQVLYNGFVISYCKGLKVYLDFWVLLRTGDDHYMMYYCWETSICLFMIKIHKIFSKIL